MQITSAMMWQLYLKHWEMYTSYLWKWSKISIKKKNSNCWIGTGCTPSPLATWLQTYPWASGSLFWHGYTGSGRAKTPVRTPYTQERTGRTGMAEGLESTAGSPWGGRAVEEGEQRVSSCQVSREFMTDREKKKRSLALAAIWQKNEPQWIFDKFSDYEKGFRQKCSSGRKLLRQKPNMKLKLTEMFVCGIKIQLALFLNQLSFQVMSSRPLIFNIRSIPNG